MRPDHENVQACTCKNLKRQQPGSTVPVHGASGGETILHMGDIMPTHAHQNPLWVLAYDDYPMDSIYAKERLMKEALENEYYFSFYHDAYYRLLKWSKDGKEIVETLQYKEKNI